MQRVVPLLLSLAMSVPLFAQTTTTYTFGPAASGISSTPFRMFNIVLTDASSQAAAMLQDLTVTTSPYFKTACYQQALPPLGYIYLDDTVLGANSGCLPLTSSAFSGSSTALRCAGLPTHFEGAFTASLDGSSSSITGSVSFDLAWGYRSGSGRGGGGSGAIKPCPPERSPSQPIRFSAVLRGETFAPLCATRDENGNQPRCASLIGERV